MEQIVFRLDANAKIGIGHLMRCMSIADELDQQKYHLYFICGKLTNPMQSLIADKGYKLYIEDNENNILKIIEILKPDYLIVDHYGLDSKFEIKARPFSKQIIVIDDMADRFALYSIQNGLNMNRIVGTGVDHADLALADDIGAGAVQGEG